MKRGRNEIDSKVPTLKSLATNAILLCACGMTLDDVAVNHILQNPKVIVNVCESNDWTYRKYARFITHLDENNRANLTMETRLCTEAREILMTCIRKFMPSKSNGDVVADDQWGNVIQITLGTNVDITFTIADTRMHCTQVKYGIEDFTYRADYRYPRTWLKEHPDIEIQERIIVPNCKDDYEKYVLPVVDLLLPAILAMIEWLKTSDPNPEEIAIWKIK